MAKEARAQAKVEVGVKKLWRALAKDLRHILPKVAPNLVTEAELLEGDGGLGTIFLFRFGPDVPYMTYQKEQIAELDESQRRIGLRVLEGGHLNLGFTSYGTFFKLKALEERKTVIDIQVVYDTEDEEGEFRTDTPTKITEATLLFIELLEEYLLKVDG